MVLSKECVSPECLSGKKMASSKQLESISEVCYEVIRQNQWLPARNMRGKKRLPLQLLIHAGWSYCSNYSKPLISLTVRNHGWKSISGTSGIESWACANRPRASLDIIFFLNQHHLFFFSLSKWAIPLSFPFGIIRVKEHWACHWSQISAASEVEPGTFKLAFV